MIVAFFTLVIMFAASPALVPHDMKPSPGLYKGRSKDAVVPNIIILGPARPDTTEERTHRGEAPQDSCPAAGIDSTLR